MKKQIFALGVVLAIGAAAGAATGLVPIDPFSLRTADKVDSSTVSPSLSAAAHQDVPLVRSQTVTAADTAQQRQFFGRVRARETVDLALEVGGTLEQLIPEEGMRVGRGEVIAQLRLDAFERGAARAALQFAQADREAKRMRSLAASATAPEARAEDAETARDLAEVALHDARAALEDATLAAPFDGLVAARLVAEHSSISPGQPVLRLHDMSELRVEISVPERLMTNTRDLSALRFLASLPSGEVSLRLVAFQPEAERIGQAFRVTLALPHGGAMTLLPGASITVTAKLPQPTATGMTVPAAALLAENDRSAAVMVLEGGPDALRVRRVPVTVRARTGTGFVVDGLSDGAEIVTAGAYRLTDGQPVRRFAPLVFTEN